MRPILFRGKRTDNGEWVEGNLFIPDLERAETQILLGTPTVRINFNIIPETVGQYTGITDKKGLRIFEGDILESLISENPDDWKIWKVGFEDGTFTVESVRNSVKSRRKYRHDFNMLCADEVKLFGFVVVGNVHDNPDLLEREAEE